MRIAGDDESCGEKPPVWTTIRPWATALTASVMINRCEFCVPIQGISTRLKASAPTMAPPVLAA